MLILFLPWVLIMLLVMSACFAYKRWWKTAGGLVVAIILLNWLGHVFSLAFWNTKSSADQVSVMTWNIDGTDYSKEKVEGIYDVISNENPDVLYLAEDFYACCDSIDKLLRIQYPYTTHDHNLSHYFYSKYPIMGWQRIAEEVDCKAVVIEATIAIGEQKLRVYGCHFSSNNYGDGVAMNRPESIKSFAELTSYMKGISLAQNLRVAGVQEVCNRMKDVRYPCLCVGDFNDIYSSAPLRALSDCGFQDAWWDGGFGYGATIHHPLPFRIDHIMYGSKDSKGLSLRSIKKIDAKGLSDHDALVARFFLEEL